MAVGKMEEKDLKGVKQDPSEPPADGGNGGAPGSEEKHEESIPYEKWKADKEKYESQIESLSKVSVSAQERLAKQDEYIQSLLQGYENEQRARSEPKEDLSNLTPDEVLAKRFEKLEKRVDESLSTVAQTREEEELRREVSAAVQQYPTVTPESLLAYVSAYPEADTIQIAKAMHEREEQKREAWIKEYSAQKAEDARKGRVEAGDGSSPAFLRKKDWYKDEKGRVDLSKVRKAAEAHLAKLSEANA